MNNKAIFLDRDGIVNTVSLKDGKPVSPRRIEDFRFMPDIEDALYVFKRLGFLNIIITNQPDIARGLLGVKELERMHSHIRERLAIDGIFVCPHDNKDMCACRKPKPGLIFQAAKNWNIDLSRSYVIGDTHRDIESGRQAGCLTVLVKTSYNSDCKIDGDFKVGNLNEFIALLKEGRPKDGAIY